MSTMPNKEAIIEISRSLNLSHIGSCLSVLPLLEEIYNIKHPEDIVILDNAHAHLAHLIVKYKHGLIRDPLKSIEEYGIHCDREAWCDASGGSLGHGLGIAIGYALVDRKRQVYITVSEGSMMEGSSWEALRDIDDFKLTNIHIYCNFNGYSAVADIDRKKLVKRMKAFVKDIKVFYTDNGEGFDGLAGHYKTL